MSRREVLDTIDVCRLLRAECIRAGGQQAWAEAHGLSATYVSDVLNGRRGPGASITKALGLVKVTRYVKRRTGGAA